MSVSLSLRDLFLSSALLLVSAVLAWRTVDEQRYLNDLAQRRLPRNTSNLRASDTLGRPIQLGGRPADRFVLFVLRSPVQRGELDYWQEVRRALPSNVSLVGICGAPDCLSWSQGQGNLPFAAASYGSYEGVLSVLGEDRAGRVPVLDPEGEIVASVPKQQSPKALAAAVIRELHGGI